MSKAFASLSRKVVCVGRNFAMHAKELGNAVPTEPVLFLKPPSSFVGQGEPVMMPPQSSLHHEIELAVVIKGVARRIKPEEAEQYIGGYALALDMTARDIQQRAKDKGLPWTVSKGFDTHCPISDLISTDEIPDPQDAQLTLDVVHENGVVERRQDGNTRDMLFNIPTIMSHISSIMTLHENDVILTGTPAGVAAVNPGDCMKGTVSYKGKVIREISFPVVTRDSGPQ